LAAETLGGDKIVLGIGGDHAEVLQCGGHTQRISVVPGQRQRTFKQVPRRRRPPVPAGNPACATRFGSSKLVELRVKS
jgi:hypothetical protein